MTLKIYNTLTRNKDPFDPVRPGRVGMYLCGPTVYKSPHIGHMVGPIIFDTIKRYLLFKGFDVTLIVNITDVDDKLIAVARDRQTTMQAVAELHTSEYLSSLKRLGIESIDHFPKASENIPEIIEFTSKLIGKEHAYAVDGNVWFAVTSDADYGRLSGRKLDEQSAGTRDTESAGKRHPADFALWKAAKPGEPSWDSPWGKGRPGWHIECSAMATKYLGETFDIHGGGDDLKFPHHENELAQSECCTGKPFARFWLHNGLTRMKTKAAGDEYNKISGSVLTLAGNETLLASVSVDNLLSTHGPELLRYLLLSTHYRRPIDFSDDVIIAMKKGLSSFHRMFDRMTRLNVPLADEQADIDVAAQTLLDGPNGDFVKLILDLKMRWLEMMDDDFNTAGALASMHEMLSAINACVDQAQLEKSPDATAMNAVTAAVSTVRKLGKLLGLFTFTPHAEEPANDQLTAKLMGILIELRAQARETKNFSLADDIRTKLASINVTLEDRAGGTGWKRN